MVPFSCTGSCPAYEAKLSLVFRGVVQRMPKKNVELPDLHERCEASVLPLRQGLTVRRQMPGPAQ